MLGSFHMVLCLMNQFAILEKTVAEAPWVFPGGEKPSCERWDSFAVMLEHIFRQKFCSSSLCQVAL